MTTQVETNLHNPKTFRYIGGYPLIGSDPLKNLSENLTISMGLSSQGKSTSLEARRLLKADQRIGQAEKGLKSVTFFCKII